MTFSELIKEKIFIIVAISLIISVIINLLQFFKFMKETKLPYSTVSFRNMMYTTMAILFGVPIAEGLLSNFGIKLSETGLISPNTKDIYYFAMSFFCLPYIIPALGSQFKWFIIAYLATIFRNSASISVESLNMFKDIVQMIITEKPIEIAKNKESEQVLYTEDK